MNRSIIRYLLGQVLKIEAMLLLLPCIMAVVYQEKRRVCLFDHSRSLWDRGWSCHNPQTKEYSFLFERRLCDNGA